MENLRKGNEIIITLLNEIKEMMFRRNEKI